MITLRNSSASHLYLDKIENGFSNVATGFLIRAMGHGLKVAYVDVSNSAVKFTNFLENLSLDYNFKKSFNRMQLDLFVFKANSKISRTIIPLVEFNSIDKQTFFSQIKTYDLVIFENYDSSVLSFDDIKNFLDIKSSLTEVICVTKNETDFKNLKKSFNSVLSYNYNRVSNTLINNKNILSVSGHGRGKSIYAFGYIIANFIFKKDVKLIYFDKGDDISGEIRFFTALKKWAKMNQFYGKFDFVVTGAKRFIGPSFRETISDEDRSEAREALMLLKTALKKQTPVIADELITILNRGVLEKEEVIEVLKGVQNELLITGNDEIADLADISTLNINLEDLSDEKVIGLRQGIDF